VAGSQWASFARRRLLPLLPQLTSSTPVPQQATSGAGIVEGLLEDELNALSKSLAAGSLAPIPMPMGRPTSLYPPLRGPPIGPPPTPLAYGLPLEGVGGQHPAAGLGSHCPHCFCPPLPARVMVGGHAQSPYNPRGAGMARIPGPAGRYAEMRANGAPPTAIQDMLLAALASKAAGAEHAELRPADWAGLGDASFTSPSWLAALQCLDVEEFDGVCAPVCLRSPALAWGVRHAWPQHPHLLPPVSSPPPRGE